MTCLGHIGSLHAPPLFLCLGWQVTIVGARARNEVLDDAGQHSLSVRERGAIAHVLPGRGNEVRIGEAVAAMNRACAWSSVTKLI